MLHWKCQRSGLAASCVTVLPVWPASACGRPSTPKTTEAAPFTVAVNVAVVAVVDVMTGLVGSAGAGVSSDSAEMGSPTAAPDELSIVDWVALNCRPCSLQDTAAVTCLKSSGCVSLVSVDVDA